MNDKISDQIVRFAIETTTSDIPESSLQALNLSLVDWIAVAIAGIDETVSTITRTLIEQEGGAQISYALGLSQRVPPRAAAFVNGASGHALDYDDTHFYSLGHPSAAVIPAALAVSDVTKTDSNEIKTAALIGMEVAVRAGVWLGRDHYRRGFHVTGTAGTFGATIASARLLGLDSEQTHHALAIAASRASGVKAQFGSMGKPLHAGFAASNGVESAQLAQFGLIAGSCALESSQGFAATHHGECNDHAFADFGRQYLIDDVSHKFHACCHGTHAAMEALLSLCEQYRIDPDSIESIIITVHPQYLDICNIVSPETGLQSKFSYHMVAALVLRRYDTARIDTFSDDICHIDELRQLHDLVTVQTDTGVSESSAEVTVLLTDGSRFNNTHDLLAPMDMHQRQSRVRAKCESILGRETAVDLWRQVVEGDTTPAQWIEKSLDKLA